MYRDDLNLNDASVESSSSGISLQQSLSAFIVKVYGWMAFALAVTALSSWIVVTSPELLRMILHNKLLFYGLIIGEVLLVIGISGLINKISAATATALFIAYAVMNGLTLSTILFMFTMSSIASTFVVTAGLFGLMALIGTVTKRDLTSIGNIAFMVLLGFIIASLVNFWLKSPALYWILTYLGVVVFSALTAYDAQKIKAMFLDSDDSSETKGKVAVLGALALYLDFINLFILLLQIFGNGSRRD